MLGSLRHTDILTIDVDRVNTVLIEVVHVLLCDLLLFRREHTLESAADVMLLLYFDLLGSGLLALHETVFGVDLGLSSSVHLGRVDSLLFFRLLLFFLILGGIVTTFFLTVLALDIFSGRMVNRA